ncbi:MAG: hypothetical protein Q9224_004003, partial [Gallowayella concinna]
MNPSCGINPVLKGTQTTEEPTRVVLGFCAVNHSEQNQQGSTSSTKEGIHRDSHSTQLVASTPGSNLKDKVISFSQPVCIRSTYSHVRWRFQDLLFCSSQAAASSSSTAHSSRRSNMSPHTPTGQFHAVHVPPPPASNGQLKTDAQNRENGAIVQYRRIQPSRDAKVYYSIEHTVSPGETTRIIDQNGTNTNMTVSDFELSPRDRLAQARRGKRRANDHGSELSKTRAASEASSSLDDDRTSSMDHLKRELTVAFDEASRRVDLVQDRKSFDNDGLVSSASISAGDEDKAILRQLVVELEKLQTKFGRMEVARQKSDTLVERVNQALDQFQAASAPGAQGSSALASSHRIDDAVPAPRPRILVNGCSDRSDGRWLDRAATMPPCARQWFGPSMDRADPQPTSTSRAVGTGDDRYDSPHSIEHGRRDGQQFADQSWYDDSALSTGESTRLHDDPSPPNLQSSPSLFLPEPESPDGQSRFPLQSFVSHSTRPVEGYRERDTTCSTTHTQDPVQSATSSSKKRQRRQRSKIWNEHPQGPTTSLSFAVASRSVHPNTPHETTATPDADPTIAGHADTLDKASLENSTGGPPSVEPSSGWGKQRAKSKTRESELPHQGLWKEVNSGGQPAAKGSCGNDWRVAGSQAKEGTLISRDGVQHTQGRQCGMMMDSSQTSGGGAEVNFMDTSQPGNYGAREDSEFPDVADIMNQFPSLRKHAGSQGCAGNQGSETEAPPRDQEPQNAGAETGLYGTTNAGPT